MEHPESIEEAKKNFGKECKYARYKADSRYPKTITIVGWTEDGYYICTGGDWWELQKHHIEAHTIDTSLVKIGDKCCYINPKYLEVINETGRCQANTKAGNLCKNKAIKGSKYCRIHNK